MFYKLKVRNEFQRLCQIVQGTNNPKASWLSNEIFNNGIRELSPIAKHAGLEVREATFFIIYHAIRHINEVFTLEEMEENTPGYIASERRWLTALYTEYEDDEDKPDWRIPDDQEWTLGGEIIPRKTVDSESTKDIPAEIRKFAELKKDGLISEKEFDKKKKELLK